MEKITLEKIENDYREAIRNKFRIEQIEGKHSHYLSNPSQALLRDLCWEIFSSNPKTEDLNVYRNFFRTDFKPEEDTSTKYTDKFKKVGGFYRGEKNPANITTVDLAAILVDFHPRPFNKFRKEIDPEDLELINDLRNTNFSTEKKSTESLVIKEEIENTSDTETIIHTEETQQIKNEELESTSISVTSIVNVDDETISKPPSNTRIYLIVGVIILGLGLFFVFFLPKNGCMQWSNDHYEVVDCDSKTQGFGMINQVELLDENLVNLKKVNVTDSTVFFDKNGDAIIWYAKTVNGIDFFNGHGRHPENNKALKPVTPYILKKYLKK